MKKGLILILCILPLVLFGQSYDRLSFTHKLTGKNYVLSPGDRVILKGLNSSGKKFKLRGTILRFENKHIVLKDRYTNDGQIISLLEINKISIVNQKKHTILLLASIAISIAILGIIFWFVYFPLAYGGYITRARTFIFGSLVVLILVLLSSAFVNSGMQIIKNVNIEWKIEQINLP